MYLLYPLRALSIMCHKEEPGTTIRRRLSDRENDKYHCRGMIEIY